MMKTKNIATLLMIALLTLCGVTASGSSGSLIPLPVSQRYLEGNFWLNPTTNVETGNTEQEKELGRYLREYIEPLFPVTSSATKSANTITLKIGADQRIKKEGYNLNVSSNAITITAADRGGLFNGIQTLLQMMPTQVYSATPLEGSYAIPCQVIVDYPEFGHRGNMMDIARTFRDKQVVLNHIDRLSHHKINTLHWHLADDEGWRVEIRSYPELAAIGGFRGGNSPVPPIYGEWDRKYGGYITQKDIREIVEYAKFRNVEIIPEIDLPGHSRTAALVYPQIACGGAKQDGGTGFDRRNVWCVSKEENFEMLETILDELCQLFPSKYIHIGGDEVQLGSWRNCPDCQKLMKEKGYTNHHHLTNYFIDRLSEMLRERGREAMVWNEVAEEGRLDKRSLVTGWESVEKAKQALSNGYKTVVCPGSYFYLDMKQSPDEAGHNWAGLVDIERLYSFGLKRAGFTPAQIDNVVGMQTTFFTEVLLSQPFEFFDYQMFPRNCALAEVGWTAEDRRNWDDFYERLTSEHLSRLGAMGVAYRQFPPIANYANRTITVEAPFEGAEVRYSSNGEEPTLDSPLYSRAIRTESPEDYQFKAFFDGVGSPSVSPTARASGTIAAGGTATIELPLEGVVKAGELWYYRVKCSDDDLQLRHSKVKDSQGNRSTLIGWAHNVNQFNRMKLYASGRNAKGVLEVTIKNNGSNSANAEIIAERSPYIEPRVSVTSTIPLRKNVKMSRLEDYDFNLGVYTARTCRLGDQVTYTFERPVDAESIEVVTGYRHLPLYVFQKGRVQISRDGKIFEDITPFARGTTIYPDGPIRALRIVSDREGNMGNTVILQNLKIKPRK